MQACQRSQDVWNISRKAILCLNQPSSALRQGSSINSSREAYPCMPARIPDTSVISFRAQSRKTQRTQLPCIEVKDPFFTTEADLDRQATRSLIPDISISVAACHRMLHSSNSRVHLPAPSSGHLRKNARRGRLQVSAAIKKGKEKNVVCTKTIVAKQDTVSSHTQK